MLLYIEKSQKFVLTQTDTKFLETNIFIPLFYSFRRKKKSQNIDKNN